MGPVFIVAFSYGILVTSSRGYPQQVVRVVLVVFGKRHTDTRAAVHRSRPPVTNQVSAWQAGRRSRRTCPTRTICYGHPRDDVTRMLYAENGPVEFNLYCSQSAKQLFRCWCAGSPFHHLRPAFRLRLRRALARWRRQSFRSRDRDHALL